MGVQVRPGGEREEAGDVGVLLFFVCFGMGVGMLGCERSGEMGVV